MRGRTRADELTDGTRLARRGRIAEYGGAKDRAEVRVDTCGARRGPEFLIYCPMPILGGPYGDM